MPKKKKVKRKTKRKTKKKKRKAKFLAIKKGRGATLKRYDYKESIKSIQSTLKKIRAQREEELRETSAQFRSSVQKSVTEQIQDILKEGELDPKILIRRLKKKIRRAIKRSALRQSLNDAYLQVNRGEELAINAVRQEFTKSWMTQFDDRVREWHAAVHNQKRRKNKLFRVPYPGGVDELHGPKIPPISVQNFINCRCFMEFRIRGRRKR